MEADATLKMRAGENFWDNLSISISYSKENYLIHLKDRFSCLELNRQLTIAYFDGHEGELVVNIDGREYEWCQSIWHAVLSTTDQWFEEYMIIEVFDKEEHDHKDN